jgi:hypothetical protein
LLQDPEWSHWSDAEVARRCAVSDRFVSKLRRQLSPNDSGIRKATRNGATYSINTAGMATRQPAGPQATAGPVVEAEDPVPWCEPAIHPQLKCQVVVVDPPASAPQPEFWPVPPERFAADDAVLWWWTTNTGMDEALQGVYAAGFTTKSILTWVKDTSERGAWLNEQTEHCILAVRGAPKIRLSDQTTVIRGQPQEPFRRPETFFSLVESLSEGPRIYLFARGTRPGWIFLRGEGDEEGA